MINRYYIVAFPCNRILLGNKKEQTADTWEVLKGIILSENRQTENTTWYILPLIWHSKKPKLYGQKTDQWMPGARGMQARRLPAKGH